MLMEPTRTTYQSPWQDWVAKRFVRTVRRELLDHVIVRNERHLRQLIEAFVDQYNADRTHLGAGKDSPCGRPVEPRPGLTSNVVSLPRVGDLHHRYAWRRAAEVASTRQVIRPRRRKHRRKGVVWPLVAGAVHSRVWRHDRGPVTVVRRPALSRVERPSVHGSCPGDPPAPGNRPGMYVLT
jgi:hypothetical protein